MTPQLDEFTESYLECALWSTNDQSNEQGGDPLDRNYSIEDIDPESLKAVIEDCARFKGENWTAISPNWSQAGHDFWLTRNRHGAGFWDGDWSEPAVTRLTKASKQFGTVNVYVGDNGTLYFN